MTHTARLVFRDGRIDRREIKGEPRERIHIVTRPGSMALTTFRRHGDVTVNEAEYVEDTGPPPDKT